MVGSATLTTEVDMTARNWPAATTPSVTARSRPTRGRVLEATVGNTGVRALRPRRGSLRADPLPPLRALRDRPARHLARAVAELRRRPAAGHAPRDPPPRLRPRHHPLRPGQQLRPALRRGGAQLRPHLRRGLQALPRRAHHLDQGGLGHVARAVRRRRLAQVPAGQPGPEPAAHGPGLRRHLLLAPRRPRHAARGDDGRAAQRRARRARRCTPASPPTAPTARSRPRTSCARWARRCSSTSPATR